MSHGWICCGDGLHRGRRPAPIACVSLPSFSPDKFCLHTVHVLPVSSRGLAFNKRSSSHSFTDERLTRHDIQYRHKKTTEQRDYQERLRRDSKIYTKIGLMRRKGGIFVFCFLQTKSHIAGGHRSCCPHRSCQSYPPPIPLILSDSIRWTDTLTFVFTDCWR